MAKDFFQDITPPGDFGPKRPMPPSSRADVPPPPLPTSEQNDDDEEASIPINITENPNARMGSVDPQPRGIRTIAAPIRRSRVGGDMRETPGTGFPPRPHRGIGGKWLMWVAAGIVVVVLGGLLLFAFRSTTVTVTPKSHTVVFGPTSQYTAYPAATAASGTLTYTVQTSDFEDSEVVAANGTTTTPAAKASGSITVYNSYQTTALKLIKNTRFETPDGLVFRVPAEVSIPGKKGSIPGQVTVTVIADQPGAKYNVGPISRLTLPGLKANAPMYANVYAKSTGSMTGGSDGGTGPSIAPETLSTAIANVRSRLEGKARSAADTLTNANQTALSSMMQVVYTDEPSTNEAGGGVRIHESAHVIIPVFPSDQFARTVAQSVSADAEDAPITLVPGKAFTGAIVSGGGINLGSDPLDFSLSGQATLVWNVDTNALASALAGKESGAFQTIVNTFPGIQEAHARIEPFWKTTFPASAASIKISVVQPSAAQ